MAIDHILKQTQKSSMGTHQDFPLPVFHSDLKNIVFFLSPHYLTHRLNLLNTNHKIVTSHKATAIILLWLLNNQLIMFVWHGEATTYLNKAILSSKVWLSERKKTPAHFNGLSHTIFIP